MKASQETLLDIARHLASHEPQWESEDSFLKIRIGGQRYFTISEVDAGRLNALRELVLKLSADA